MLVGTAGLGAAALVAAWLAVSRRPTRPGSGPLKAAARAGGIALLCQIAHFGEELATGFREQFPASLGLMPWSATFFVSFNGFWILAWAVSCLAVTTGARLALFPLWFLAIGSLANGVAHPLLAVASARYFPGLITSPLVGVAGYVLLRRLATATRVESEASP